MFECSLYSAIEDVSGLRSALELYRWCSHKLAHKEVLYRSKGTGDVLTHIFGNSVLVRRSSFDYNKNREAIVCVYSARRVINVEASDDSDDLCILKEVDVSGYRYTNDGIYIDMIKKDRMWMVRLSTLSKDVSCGEGAIVKLKDVLKEVVDFVKPPFNYLVY